MDPPRVWNAVWPMGRPWTMPYQVGDSSYAVLAHAVTHGPMVQRHPWVPRRVLAFRVLRVEKGRIFLFDFHHTSCGIYVRTLDSCTVQQYDKFDRPSPPRKAWVINVTITSPCCVASPELGTHCIGLSVNQAQAWTPADNRSVSSRAVWRHVVRGTNNKNIPSISQEWTTYTPSNKTQSTRTWFSSSHVYVVPVKSLDTDIIDEMGTSSTGSMRSSAAVTDVVPAFPAGTYHVIYST